MIRKLKFGYRLYSRKKDPKNGKRRNLGTFETRGPPRSTNARCHISSGSEAAARAAQLNAPMIAPIAVNCRVT